MRVRTSTKTAGAVPQAAVPSQPPPEPAARPAEDGYFMMELGHGLVLTLRDDLNWTLDRERVREKGKRAGETYREVIGYYGTTPVPALRRALNLVALSAASEFRGSIDAACARLVELIDPVRTRVFEAELEGAKVVAAREAREAAIRECAGLAKDPATKAAILGMLGR